MILTSCMYEDSDYGDEASVHAMPVLRAWADAHGEKIQESSSIPDMRSLTSQVSLVVLGPACCSWNSIVIWEGGGINTMPGHPPVIHYRENAVDYGSPDDYARHGVIVAKDMTQFRKALDTVSELRAQEIAEVLASIKAAATSRETRRRSRRQTVAPRRQTLAEATGATSNNNAEEASSA